MLLNLGTASRDHAEKRNRMRCRGCDLYFDPEEEGLALVSYCFSCIPRCDPHNPEALAAYHWPTAPAPDPHEICREMELTKMRHALYFLYQALSGTSNAMNPSKSASSALDLFKQNFPDFAE